MRIVYKYKVPITDYVEIDLPSGAEILTYQSQGDTPCIWALVSPGMPMEKRRFRVSETGHAITEDALKYIGTCRTHEGKLFWHLFEIL